VVINNEGDGGSVISLHLANGDVTNVLSTMSTEVFALWVLRGNGDGTVQAP